MTAPSIVGPRQRGLVVAALADDQVVGVSGAGGYQLAARLGSDAALLALTSLVGSGPGGARHVVIGRRGDAVGLASDWSETTRQLTESVWPGPLMVVVSARLDLPFAVDPDDHSVRLAMPKARALRLVCRRTGPLAVVAPGGEPPATAEDLRAQFALAGLGPVLNEGPYHGPGPTEVDCRVSPPAVRRVGELPAAYVDAVLLMAARRRKRFGFLTSRRAAPS